MGFLPFYFYENAQNKKWLSFLKKEIYRDSVLKIKKYLKKPENHLVLNEYSRKSIASYYESCFKHHEERKFFLLKGVTVVGKTEIFITNNKLRR